MKPCSRCGRENDDDARFCSGCGAPLGASLYAREERKVVSCLFCDLVGFTARAESMDPEDVRGVLQPYHARVRSELERFGGTVEKFIGDAVMAVFGAPVAHEDDPERAVRAALSIRDLLVDGGELEIRIGITTGEALVALGARPEAGEGMASGDVVNTAARLQAAAATNAILVDETTYRATERAIAYRAAPPVTAKGKAQPVRVWEALEATARLGVDVRQLGATSLVGRDDELRTLVAALDRSRRAREPQLVTLVGVPGIGKSRLVWELFQVVDRGRELTTWRQGRSLPYGEGVTFWALSEIVKAHAGILETDGSEETRLKLRAALDLGGRDEDREWLERNLQPLVGLEADRVAEDRRTETFAGWRRFFELLAEQRPLVLVFEDLHWADDAMLDFVDHLIDWATGVPILVLATARPELLDRRAGWGGGKSNSTTISLAPLGEDETAKLVHALLDVPVLPAVTQASLIARAGGNPLYAEEFARLLRDGRSPDELPETVQGLIAARLDGLNADEKTTVQAAAVIGKTFWLGAVSDVAGAPRWTTEEHLHSLERKDFVRRERRSSVAGEVEYAFRHLLTRDVAYGQIPRVARGEQHRRTAQWIETLGRPEEHAELLARHYLAALELAIATSGDVAALTDRARASARDAGARALRLNAFVAAAALFSRALELTDADDAERPELLFQLGSALVMAADERAADVLAEAAEALVRAGRAERAGEAHSLLSNVWWYRGERDRAETHLARALELVRDEDSEEAARVLVAAGRRRSIEGDPEAAVRDASAALAIAERVGLDDIRVHALGTIGVARLRLGDERGLADLELSLELGVRSNNPRSAIASNDLGVYAFLVGDVRRAESIAQRTISLGERFGDRRVLRWQQGARPQFLYHAGRWDEALEVADEFIAECERDPHYLEPAARWPRALMRFARDEDADADVDAARGLELARQAKDPQILLPQLALRIRLDSERGRDDVVRETTRETLQHQPEHGALPPAVELAWVAERLGVVPAVRAWIDSIRYASRWSEAARAILDGHFEQAADVFVQIGSLPNEARARVRTGNPVQMLRGLELYRSVGATRYVRDTEAVLGKASEISA